MIRVQGVAQAACFISEQGMGNLMLAGMATGWLRGWLMAAGAQGVSFSALEDDSWQATQAAWQLFIAAPDELAQVALQHGVDLQGSAQVDSTALINPERRIYAYPLHGCRVLLLPSGDIAYQRRVWLKLLSDTVLTPLYIAARDDLPITLEPGLSATLAGSADLPCLNNAGLLPEEQVIAALLALKLTVRTVESCTAGSIIARLCRVPGASAVVDRAWVTYSNAAKQDEVGVDVALIMQHGAVSRAVVQAMAEGGADDAHICMAVSGIAGPGGGTADKAVGTVWIAVAGGGAATVSRCVQLAGARHEVQSRSVIALLSLLLAQLSTLAEPA